MRPHFIRPFVTLLSISLFGSTLGPSPATAHERAPESAPVGAPVQAETPKPPQSAAGDGPYVLRTGKGWAAKSIGANLELIEKWVAPKGRVTIAAVRGVPAFNVRLREPVATPAPGTLALNPTTKLLVLADTHGEYEILVAFLRQQGVVDGKLKWKFGKGELVVTGDMFDRGTHQLEILWLFYKLEAEAKRAGGALHVLLGNHKSMVLRGDLRYLHPRYPEAARILGAASYDALFTRETVLGNWLRSRPAVLKLGDLLFLHGGISPAIVDAKLGIADMNKGIRLALDTPLAEAKSLDSQVQLIAGSSGPLWYRGYFGRPGQQVPETEIDRSLSTYGVSRILVGHTIVDKVTPLYGGKVVAVQVYPHRDDTSGAPVLEGALREKGQWYRVGATGLREPLGN